VTANLTNKPVTPTREMLELLKDWQAPDVTASKKASVVGKTNFLGVPIEELYKAKPTLIEREDEEEVHQLTAEEVEAIRQQAYDEGFTEGKEAGFEVGKIEGLEAGKIEGLELGQKEGFDAGIEEGRETGELQIKRWQELADKLYQPNERLDATIEQQLLNLAVMLAESVIRVEVKSNKESLLKILQESVSALPFNTEFCELHLHPDDIELLQESISEEEMIENKWIFKPETHFQHGDVIVATPNSLIDRSVKQRIKQSIEQFIEDAGLKDELNEQSKIGIASDLEQEDTP
jgi:flagellar assembly protein FliH